MQIREESLGFLDEHAGVSIGFEVSRILELTVRDGGLGGFELIERPVEPAYQKDYDGQPGSRPGDWARSFDVANWGLISAWEGQQRLGGAVIAFDTEGVWMLEGRTDLAVLWDLRVAPEARSKGIGAALFAAAVQWAAERNCQQLKIETQNINVPACRFYARQGCALHAIHRFAYPEFPEEIQLLWYKDLVDLP
ncbi:MAG: GNAT family N-acetyltransferase [bacterium]|nr:GNAT family N-acetyltransferase [bacterium]MCP5068998.1 GNAT family N-acetyltransferase [bacterium]